jgi:hypothetical protein
MASGELILIKLNNMRVKLLNTYKLVGTNWKFHKGRVYRAEKAVNQPNYEKLGLYFVIKKNNESILLSTLGGEIRLIDDK